MKTAMKRIVSLALVLVSALCLTTGIFAATPCTAVKSDGQTVDTLDGVAAKYIRGTGNSNTGTYCCAQYVKNYYAAIYGGISVTGMVTNGSPNASKGSFQQTTSPQKGDVGYQTNSQGKGHWFIVKSVSGASAIVIEQNWKWKTNGVTYAAVNRVVTPGSTPNLKFFRYSGAASTPTVSSSSAPSHDTAALEDLLFDADLYDALYPDLQRAFSHNTAALKSHWKNCGIKEGRTASVFFDAAWYLQQNPDVAEAYGSQNYAGAYSHFVNYGFWEGRQGSRFFCARDYLARYSDLKAAFGSDYVAAANHFRYCGMRSMEMRQGSQQFSLRTYYDSYGDLRSAFGDNMLSYLIHYIQFGLREGRRCV